MPRRTHSTQSQSQNPTDTFNNVPGISFTYSKNFNNVVELNTENFLSWRTSMLHFLDMNNLIDYIINEKIKNLLCRP